TSDRARLVALWGGMNEHVGRNGEFGKSGHRSRLRERLLEAGADGFHDYELIEYLLMLTIPRIDTKPLAKRLVNDFGGIGPLLSEIGRASCRERVSEAAIGALKIAEATALRL